MPETRMTLNFIALTILRLTKVNRVRVWVDRFEYADGWRNGHDLDALEQYYLGPSHWWRYLDADDVIAMIQRQVIAGAMQPVGSERLYAPLWCGVPNA